MTSRFRPTPWRLIAAIAAVLALPGCEGCDPEPENPWKQGCLRLDEVRTDEVAPAGVRTVFQARDCEGVPIADLTSAEVEILLDGEEMHIEGDVAPILTQEVDFEQDALLLLDLSDSIVTSGNLLGMLDAARDAAHELVGNGNRVAVYQFAHPSDFAGLTPFTTDEATLDAAFDALGACPGFGTTDLYGAIQSSLGVLDALREPGLLQSRALIVFTDGTDEAHVSDRAATATAIDRSGAHVFTVGLGGDVNQEELRAFGKDGFAWAESAAELHDAFTEMTEQVHALAHSHYLVALCSPRVDGERTVTLHVSHDGELGELTVDYDADGFDMRDCSPAAVADPCAEAECGAVEGFSCGTCGDQAYCDEALTCVEACTAGIECGEVHGVDCGDCADGLVCDATNTCIDPCADAECGTVLGVDCGDCADGLACDPDHACVDPCADAECGTVLGVDCGGCGEGFVCNVTHECEPFSLPGLTWRELPAATTTLGCQISLDPACNPDEARREVSLGGFWIMDGEVTVGMYAACVTAGVCSAGEVDAGGLCTWDGGDEDLPLNCVSWLGLDAFCSWVGGDLPTEAQWEHAFRGDHDGVTAGYWIYPWGASPDPSCALVVMNESGVGCGTGSVQPPRSRAMTSFSLYDMAGNVAEWVYDRYGETFETCAGPCVNPTGPDAGDTRVVRGGAFDDIFGGSFRTAKRDAEAPATRSAAIGGRCVRGTW